MRLNIQATELAMADTGLNKSDLARKMGVSRMTVYNHLLGGPLKPRMAKKYADVLGVAARDIVVVEQDESAKE